MSKSQVNFRLPDTLIAALKDQAESEGITSTEMAIRLLEAGLGLSTTEEAIDDSRIEERIEQRIAPLREQVTQLNQCIELRIATAIQKELDPLLGELSA
jgi:ferritin-like metal-binding protein YciE